MALEVACRLLSIADAIKLAHWFSGAYSEHKATDTVHEKFSELIDTFMEVYIGKYGRGKTSAARIRVEARLPTDIKRYLMDDAIPYLQTGLGISDSDAELVNIRDEIVALVYQGLYLLRLS